MVPAKQPSSELSIRLLYLTVAKSLLTEHLCSPITFNTLAIYVGFFTVLQDPHGSISTIFSYIPFTSPIVMLMRIPFGVSLWEQLLSLLILLITFVLTLWIAAKIYRVGILMYGKKPSYRDLVKWLKY